ncbi:hypothetical protein FHG87_013467 [Trinorchestia longiramus]|nr:hypothetical protein FHG87_013467 [Trinorchestia longiramus]
MTGSLNMRGVACVPLLLVAFVVHSVVSVRPPSNGIYHTSEVDSSVEFSPSQRGVLVSPLHEAAKGFEEEELNVNEGGKISRDFFLGHRDWPLVALPSDADVLSGRSYDQDYLFDERPRGNRADDAFESAHYSPGREPFSIHNNFNDKYFSELSYDHQMRDTTTDFGRGRFRRSSDESKPLKKKIRTHFRVQSTLRDQKSGMNMKKNSERSITNRRDDVSIHNGKPDVQERTFQGKSDEKYHSGEDSVQQSSNYRYNPIGLHHDEDHRPDYYFQASDGVYDGTNEHQSRNPRDEFSSVQPEETGFHQFSFYESVDDFNKNFISTHPQNFQGPSNHHRTPYTQSKFKNAVDHKPPPKTQQYSENENHGININHESYSFSDPHSIDIITDSPHSPHTSSGASNTRKRHDNKERNKDPHVAYLESLPYASDRHPTGKGETHDADGKKGNYYHANEPTIYSPKNSNYEEYTANPPHHQHHGGKNLNSNNPHIHRGSDVQDDRHSGSSPDYHHDDYDNGHGFRGDHSHVSYSGNDQHGHHNGINHQRYNQDGHKSIGYENGDQSSHGPHSSRPSNNDHPYSKRASQTSSSHPNHSLEKAVGHSHSGSPHSGQNIHPNNFDRSPFQPTHELSSEHGHGVGYSFYESNAGGRAHDHHNRVIEGSHSPSYFTAEVHGPLNEGGDFFHVEENIADLPEFFGTGSHESDAPKFRNNENFAPNNIDSFKPLQLADSYTRSPYTHEKRHTASYRQEKPFKPYENSLHSSGPSTFERFRYQNSNKRVRVKHPDIQQHALNQSARSTLRSSPLPLNASARPRTRPHHALPPHGSGLPMGSSLMQFLNNLPTVNWSGRPTYRTIRNSF